MPHKYPEVFVVGGSSAYQIVVTFGWGERHSALIRSLRKAGGPLLSFYQTLDPSRYASQSLVWQRRTKSKAEDLVKRLRQVGRDSKRRIKVDLYEWPE